MTAAELIRLIAADAPVGVVLTDAQVDLPGPIILYVNDAFCRLVGRDRDGIVGQSPRFMQGRETRRPVLDTYRAALVAGERFHGFLANYRSDGTRYRAEIDCRPVRNAAGDVDYFVSFEREVVRRIGRPMHGEAGRYEPTSLSNELLPPALKALGAFSTETAPAPA